MDTDAEAGPSRPRRTPPPSTPHQSDVDTDTDADGQSASQRTTSRPASPETAFASRLPEADEPPLPPAPHLDLAAYPTATLLRLIANLLQQIASANDQIRPEAEEADGDTAGDQSHSSRSASRASSVAPGGGLPSPTAALFSERDTFPTARTASGGIDPSSPLPLFTASRTSLVHPSSLLSFHARHVPSISIEAYLLRILKYCPTTNEVFLSLLVYFDRMSRLGTASGVGAGLVGKNGKGFAIDSFNVHRLVIAGVTVASKFFSDVFYTNSRYAKVGGLPPHELNQLELQFLLLNDFRLAIPTDEMQRYGDRLLSYWEGREEETGVDVLTGRELSENGRKRVRERREKEREEREKAEKAKEEEERAAGGMEVDGETHWPKGEEIAEQGGMEVEQAEQASEASPAVPALPPPEPAETASAPPTPADGATGSDDESSRQPAPTQHSASAPPLQHSTTAPLPTPPPSMTSPATEDPTPYPKIPNNPTPTVMASTPNGVKQKERSSSVSRPSVNGTRSMSFSRGEVDGMAGRGWGNGEQGVVAVSGTG